MNLNNLPFDELMDILVECQDETIMEIVDIAHSMGKVHALASRDIPVDLFHALISLEKNMIDYFAKYSRNEYFLDIAWNCGVKNICLLENPHLPLGIAKKVILTNKDVEKICCTNKNDDVVLYALSVFTKCTHPMTLRDVCLSLRNKEMVSTLLDRVGNGSVEEKIIAESVDKEFLDVFYGRDNTEYVNGTIIKRSDDQSFINSFQNSTSPAIVSAVISKTDDVDYLRRMWKEYGDEYVKNIAGRKIAPDDLLMDIATHTQQDGIVKVLWSRCMQNHSLVSAIIHNESIRKSDREYAKEYLSFIRGN